MKENQKDEMSFLGRLLRENLNEDELRLRINEIAPTRLKRVTPR